LNWDWLNPDSLFEYFLYFYLLQIGDFISPLFVDNYVDNFGSKMLQVKNNIATFVLSKLKNNDKRNINS